MTIEVISANYGSKDPELKRKYPVKMYKDECKLFVDPRRNSRIHKILIHKYSDADYTIWVDANITLLKSPEEIVKMMGDYDVMAFKHQVRDCLYDEAVECARLKLDDPQTIANQVAKYKQEEFPAHRGLVECGFMVRKNNEKTRRLNEIWWAEYCAGCRRDQISFMYALDKSEARIKVIPEYYQIQEDGSATRGGITRIVSHSHFEGNWNQNHV